MMNLPKVVIATVLLGVLFSACEDEAIDGIMLPLAGTYTLNEMTINVEATTLNDTSVHFLVTQNGMDSVQLDAGTSAVNLSDHYTDQDTNPIGGVITLNNDGSASLTGGLPVNVGSGCQPILTILELSSDGSWQADTSSGTFSIDLVYDALDIDGGYILNGDQLEVRYLSIEENDERVISKIDYEGVEVGIVPMCIPVSSITERVMKLTLN